MKLLYIHLKNFCQYEDFRHDYRRGILGVLGENGVGKSNFLYAAHLFAMTGDAPEGDKKSDLLRWGSKSGSVTWCFEVDGVEYTLARNIHNAGISLSWGSEELTKSGEVDEMLLKLFGMSSAVASEICFVPQGKFLEIITSTHAKRMEYFQRLAGALKAETLRGVLQEKLNTLPVFPDRSEEIQKLVEELEDQTAQKKSLELTVFDMEAEKAEYLDCYQQALKLLGLPSYGEHAKKISVKQQELGSKISGLQTLEKSLNLGKALLPVEPPSAEERNEYDNYCEYESTREQADRNSKKIEEHEKSKPIPKSFNILGMETRISEKEASLQEVLWKEKLVLEGVCPTCRKEYVPTEEEKEKVHHRAVIEKELETLKQALQKERKAKSTYETAVAVWESTAKTLLYHQSEHNRNLQDLQGVEQFDVNGYLKKEFEYEEYTRQLGKRNDPRLKSFEKEITRLEAELEFLGKESVITDEEKKNYLEIRDTYESLLREISSRKEELAGLKSDVSNKTERLTLLRQESEKSEKSRKIREVLERSRDVLHRDNLPKVVMKVMLASVNLKMENYLSGFQTNFTARLDENFNFVCRYSSLEERPAKRLSGGQKVALALAFRFALADVMGSTLPILIMDEPTVFLDKKNQAAMAEVLGKARAHVEKTGFILIATHNGHLEQAFTHTVTFVA